MKLLLVIDSHIYKSKDGNYWCKGITDETFFQRYLNIFDKIKIISRVKEINTINTDKLLSIANPNIEFVDMPFVRSAKQYILNYRVIKKRVLEETKDCECVIYRVPSIIAFMTYIINRKKKMPSAIEVVADPEDAYKDNLIAKIIGKCLLKNMAKKVNGVSYVTEKFLQSKYPANNRKKKKEFFESYYSSIDLNNDFFGKPKTYATKKEYIISHTANISNTMSKGQDILIKAVGILNKKGYNIKIIFIGDSEIKDKYYEIAMEYGIKNQITFTGILPRKEQLREQLIKSDLFVLPTQAEGLPRSIIEAMAVGLPCISTPVGGVSELLSEKYLIEQKDFKGLANLIEKLLNNNEKLEKMSKMNIKKAEEYKSEILLKKRNEFYKRLKEIAEKTK